VNLSSAGHRFADVDLEDPTLSTRPTRVHGLRRSKTANALLPLSSIAVTSGGCGRRRSTPGHPNELGRYMTAEVREKLIANINASQPKAPPFSWKSIPKAPQLLCGPPASPMQKRLVVAIAKTATSRDRLDTWRAWRRTALRPRSATPQALWRRAKRWSANALARTERAPGAARGIERKRALLERETRQ